jgi:O-antigen/teichoic acid export membrane protein
VLIWALPGALVAGLLFHLLAAVREQGRATWAVGLTAAFNVGINLVLIPRWSFLGAAVSTVASEILCVALMLAVFRIRRQSVGLLDAAWRPLAAAGALGTALAIGAPVLPHGTPGLLITAAFAVPAYGLFLVVTRALGPRDANLLRELARVKAAA